MDSSLGLIGDTVLFGLTVYAISQKGKACAQKFEQWRNNLACRKQIESAMLTKHEQWVIGEWLQLFDPGW